MVNETVLGLAESLSPLKLIDIAWVRQQLTFFRDHKVLSWDFTIEIEEEMLEIKDKI